jgi:hypothetical protein
MATTTIHCARVLIDWNEGHNEQTYIAATENGLGKKVAEHVREWAVKEAAT